MTRFLPAHFVAAMFAVALLGAMPACAFATEIVGPVARVPSGDTLIVTSGARDVEVRLADIGAPHGSEFYAPAANDRISLPTHLANINVIRRAPLFKLG